MEGKFGQRRDRRLQVLLDGMVIAVIAFDGSTCRDSGALMDKVAYRHVQRLKPEAPKIRYFNPCSRSRIASNPSCELDTRPGVGTRGPEQDFLLGSNFKRT